MSGTKLTINPMTVGAEVNGLDLSEPIPDSVRKELYAAWMDYGILLFHNVDTNEKHLKLSRCFGELELHPMPELRDKDEPLLIALGGVNRTPAFVYDEKYVRVSVLPWHRDTAYTPEVCKGAMLRLLVVPKVAGETMFSDTANAYDALPDDIKAKIDNLEYKATLRVGPVAQTRPGAFWKTVRPATPEEDPYATPDVRDVSMEAAKRYPSVVHPVVIIHPESGRKCLFLSPTYFDCFLGMDEEEGLKLHTYLVDHVTSERFVYTHKWTVNDAMLWDNRRFMHAARGNAPDEVRSGLRTTLAGATRTGRFYDADEAEPENWKFND